MTAPASRLKKLMFGEQCRCPSEDYGHQYYYDDEGYNPSETRVSSSLVGQHVAEGLVERSGYDESQDDACTLSRLFKSPLTEADDGSCQEDYIY